MAADLIDEYLLMIHSLVLGTGAACFLRGCFRIGTVSIWRCSSMPTSPPA